MYRIGGEFKEEWPDVIPELNECYLEKALCEERIKKLEEHDVYGKYLWWMEIYRWDKFLWEQQA